MDRCRPVTFWSRARAEGGLMAARRQGIASRLYRGEVSYDFIGHRKRWYLFSGALIVLSLVSMLVRGLRPPLAFKGGAVFQFPRHGHSISDVNAAVRAAGVTPEIVTVTGSGSVARFRVEPKALVQNTTVDKGKK